MSLELYRVNEKRKIKRDLNRLYWAFIVAGLVITAYGVGWIVAYTGSCVCKV